jgi:hypothetical protein
VTQWRQIVGWPYEVSDDGQVRRAAPARNSYVGKVLRPNTDRYGYLYVRLSRSGQVKDFKVHRLVCWAFNGPPADDEDQVCHIDGDQTNNVPSNLTWGTAQANADDRHRHGTTQRGEAHFRSLLTVTQVQQLRREADMARVGRRRVPRGFCFRKAKELGVTEYTVRDIISKSGKSWRWL